MKPDPSKQFDCDGMPLYFLAVALRDSVQLFKLELSDTEIAAHETPIEIPVDSFVCKMVSTPLGRLFVGCSDGCVYELHYEEEVPPRPLLRVPARSAPAGARLAVPAPPRALISRCPPR